MVKPLRGRNEAIECDLSKVLKELMGQMVENFELMPKNMAKDADKRVGG